MSWRLRVFLVIALSAPAAFAIDTTDTKRFDFGVKTAFVLGNLNNTTDDPDIPGATITTPVQYGGVAVGIAANFDFNRWLSVSAGLHFVLDINLFQLTRKGLDLTAAFYLMGGARRTMVETDEMVVMERDPYGVALLFRPGFYGYSPTSGTATATQIDASILGIDVGAQYRMDLNDNMGLDMSFLYSLITLPASGSQVKAALMTFEVSLRMFL